MIYPFKNWTDLIPGIRLRIIIAKLLKGLSVILNSLALFLLDKAKQIIRTTPS